MNLGFAECKQLAHAYRLLWENELLSQKIDLVVCPPLESLITVASELQGSGIGLGAQNVFWQDKGSYTGEIAASTLKELQCSHVIIGHSERRTNLNETNEMVNRKIKAALNVGLIPILCVGEMYDERIAGQSDLVIMRQVIEGLNGVTLHDDSHLIVAYEPVWAIGTGQAIEPGAADHASHIIRHALLDMFPLDIVDHQVRMIYGGSVDAGNIATFLSIPLMSGTLVGSVSVSIKKFTTLLAALP